MTDRLNYLEKSYPIKVGYYAIKHTQREIRETTNTELSMENVLRGDLEVMEPMIYYALKMGHRLEGQEMTISRDEIEFMLDVCLFDFLKLVQKFKPDEQPLGKSEGEEGQEQISNPPLTSPE